MILERKLSISNCSSLRLLHFHFAYTSDPDITRGMYGAVYDILSEASLTIRRIVFGMERLRGKSGLPVRPGDPGVELNWRGWPVPFLDFQNWIGLCLDWDLWIGLPLSKFSERSCQSCMFVGSSSSQLRIRTRSCSSKLFVNPVLET